MMDLLNVKTKCVQIISHFFFPRHYQKLIDLNGFVLDIKHLDQITSKKFTK